MIDWSPATDAAARWSIHGEIGVSARSLGGEDWEFNADRRFVAASTIKIPVMIALFRQIDAGEKRLGDLIVLGGAERIPGSGVLQHLHAGLQLTAGDLCTLMIAISDNTATNMLVDFTGLDRVNETIRDLGMDRSTMGRKMLGRRATSADGENWVTPRNLTTAVAAIVDGHAASAESCERMMTMLARQDQCRRVTRFAPEDSRWGSKPGTLPGIVNDAGFIQTGKGTAVISVCCEEFAQEHEAELAIAEISRGALETLGMAG